MTASLSLWIVPPTFFPLTWQPPCGICSFKTASAVFGESFWRFSVFHFQAGRKEILSPFICFMPMTQKPKELGHSLTILNGSSEKHVTFSTRRCKQDMQYLGWSKVRHLEILVKNVFPDGSDLVSSAAIKKRKVFVYKSNLVWKNCRTLKFKLICFWCTGRPRLLCIALSTLQIYSVPKKLKACGNPA